MKKNKQKTALITGPTSGIGFELISLFCKDNINLVLVSRNKERLQNIKENIIKNYDINVTIFPIDLSNVNSAKKVFDFCLEHNLEIDYLVNNAGFGIYGLFEKTSIQLIVLLKLNILLTK